MRIVSVQPPTHAAKTPTIVPMTVMMATSSRVEKMLVFAPTMTRESMSRP